jgi:HK97 family phage prohead protease
MGTKLEQRSFNFEVRAENSDSGSRIVGRPIVYDEKTDLGIFDEIIEKGALDNTDLTDVRFLVNHDISRIPLARSRRNNGNSTMQLSVDDKGLGISVDLDTENNAEARSLYSAVERGDISGMSFMFFVDEENDEWEDLDSDHPTRRIKAIDSVLEVSAVTFPAYPQTSISTRSKELDSSEAVLERARNRVNRSASVETDTNTLALLKAKNEIYGRF